MPSCLRSMAMPAVDLAEVRYSELVVRVLSIKNSVGIIIPMACERGGRGHEHTHAHAHTQQSHHCHCVRMCGEERRTAAKTSHTLSVHLCTAADTAAEVPERTTRECSSGDTSTLAVRGVNLVNKLWQAMHIAKRTITGCMPMNVLNTL